MPYNFVAESFHTRNFVADFLQKVHFYTENRHFAFSHPLWGRGLGATYAVHLRLIGKLLVDFLSVIIDFFANLLRLVFLFVPVSRG